MAKQQPTKTEEQRRKEAVSTRDRTLIAAHLSRPQPSSAPSAYLESDAIEGLDGYRFSDQDAQLCAACGHRGLRHSKDGCLAGKNGLPFRDAGYPPRSYEELRKSGELCWCPTFASDSQQGQELRLNCADLGVLKAEIIGAIDQRNPALARRAYEQYLERSPHTGRDVELLKSFDRQIGELHTLPSRSTTKSPTVAEKVLNPDVHPTLTVKETMSYLGISRSAVYRWAEEGKLDRADNGKTAGKRAKVSILISSVKRVSQPSSE